MSSESEQGNGVSDVPCLSALPGGVSDVPCLSGLPGGHRTLPSVLTCDPTTREWRMGFTRPHCLATARSHHSCVKMDDRLWVVGGKRGRDQHGRSGSALSSVEVYSEHTGGWMDVGTGLTTPRYSHSCVALNGKLYVVGGRCGRFGSGVVCGVMCRMQMNIRALNSMEVFDLETMVWDAGAALTTARYDHSCVVRAGKLYVMGGYDSEGRRVLSE